MLIRRMYIGSIVLFLTLAVCVLASHANPLPSVPDEFNGLFFRNSEVIVDANNNGQVDVGEIFWGVYNINEIVAPTDVQGQTGPQIWPLGGKASPPEVTGYFVYEVTAVYDPGELGNPTPGSPYMEFGPASSDPNSIFTAADLAAGAVMRFFEDPSIDYDDSTQGLAVSTATDGALLWTLGFGPNSDNTSTSGYWYALAPRIIPPVGSPGIIGESYGGLNYLNPMLCGLVNDINETITNLDVEFWFNSEIYRLPVNEDLEIGTDVPMHFGSNDPAVYKPLEEELPGVCRVTAGGNKDSDGLTIPCDLKSNGMPDNNCIKEKISHTWGGEAGAGPNLDPNINWLHHYKSKDASFAFHSNDKDPICIMCSDEGDFCFPARYAPYRQIDFVGLGQFNNKRGFEEGTPLGDAPVAEELCFEVHLEDIGEPGRGSQWPSSSLPCEHCPGTPIVNGDPLVPGERSDCRDCTDYYAITIYDSASHDECGCTGEEVWVNGSAIDECDDPQPRGFFTRAGNVQMHPGK